MATSLTIRPAEPSDIDALTQIGIAAFPLEPQWDYRYPYRLQYPEEHFQYTRNRYSEWLSAASTPNCKIVVVEGPSNEDPKVKRVMSLSIWRIPTPTKVDDDLDKLKPPHSNPHRRDANAAHMEAFREGVERAQSELFDKVYGERQLSLAQLATHPDYFRRGAGTLLVEWGLALAEKETWAVTVFAGPKAYGVYGRLGFKKLGMAKIQAKGEEETLEFPGMAWEPSKWPKANGSSCEVI